VAARGDPAERLHATRPVMWRLNSLSMLQPWHQRRGVLRRRTRSIGPSGACVCAQPQRYPVRTRRVTQWAKTQGCYEPRVRVAPDARCSARASVASARAWPEFRVACVPQPARAVAAQPSIDSHSRHHALPHTHAPCQLVGAAVHLPRVRPRFPPARRPASLPRCSCSPPVARRLDGVELKRRQQQVHMLACGLPARMRASLRQFMNVA
jgi:hypothetical protein